MFKIKRGSIKIAYYWLKMKIAIIKTNYKIRQANKKEAKLTKKLMEHDIPS